MFVGYYYGGNPLNTSIAIELFTSFMNNDIPVRYLQLDPYWFDGGSNNNVLKWEARKDLFPQNGLFTLYSNLSNVIENSSMSYDTIPLLLYAMYWSVDTTQEYYKTNYNLSIDFMNSINFNTGWMQGPIAQPIGYDNTYNFYKFILNKYKNVTIAFDIDIFNYKFRVFC